MVRDMSRRDAAMRTGVHFGADGTETTITYDITEGADRSAATILKALEPLSVQVTAPDHSSHQVILRQTLPDHYEATIEADQSGLYRVVANGASTPLPPVGFVRSSDELKAKGVNVALLEEMARATGGGVNATSAQLLDRRGSQGFESEPLWPYLAVLALLLNFIELAWRKGHFAALIAWLGRIVPRRPQHAPEAARS
jgi:hypothetical protein